MFFRNIKNKSPLSLNFSLKFLGINVTVPAGVFKFFVVVEKEFNSKDSF